MPTLIFATTYFHLAGICCCYTSMFWRTLRQSLVWISQLETRHDSIDVYLENIALHVCQFNVNFVPEAAKIARLHELSLFHTPMKTPPTTFNSSQRSRFSSSRKNQYNTSTTNVVGNQNNKPLIPNAPQKRVSFEEMQEHKCKGLCMLSEEPFTLGHQIMHKRSEFFLLEANT